LSSKTHIDCWYSIMNNPSAEPLALSDGPRAGAVDAGSPAQDAGERGLPERSAATAGRFSGYCPAVLWRLRDDPSGVLAWRPARPLDRVTLRRLAA
jgi:hypothetical protein